MCKVMAWIDSRLACCVRCFLQNADVLPPVVKHNAVYVN